MATFLNVQISDREFLGCEGILDGLPNLIMRADVARSIMGPPPPGQTRYRVDISKCAFSI